MSDLPFADPNSIVAATVELLKVRNCSSSIHAIVQAEYLFEETSWHNWNGGTSIFSLVLTFPPDKYAMLIDEKNEIEREIASSLHHVTDAYEGFGFNVKIRTAVIAPSGWQESRSKTRCTRRCARRSGWGRSATTPSSTWCCAGSSAGRPSSTWRPTPTCRGSRSRPPRPGPT